MQDVIDSCVMSVLDNGTIEGRERVGFIEEIVGVTETEWKPRAPSKLPPFTAEIVDEEGDDSVCWRTQAAFQASTVPHEGNLLVPVKEGANADHYRVITRPEVPLFAHKSLVIAGLNGVKTPVVHHSMEDVYDLPQCEFFIDAMFHLAPKEGRDVVMIEIRGGRYYSEKVKMCNIPTYCGASLSLKAVVGLESWREINVKYPRLYLPLCVRQDECPQYFKTSSALIDNR